MSVMLRWSILVVPMVLAACVSQETGRMDWTTLPPWTAFNQSSSEEIAGAGAGAGGNASAARLAGDMYYWGDQFEPDRVKAEENWTLAAQGGDAEAVERLEAVKNGQPIKVVYGGGGLRRFFNEMGDQTFAGMDEGF